MVSIPIFFLRKKKMKLEDKVAIITGAGSGIGRTTALLFTQEGAKVVAVDIDRQAGERTVSMIKDMGGSALFIPADVSNSSHVMNMVKVTVDTYGRLDILVNVAGIFSEGDVVGTSEETWNRILGINLLGIFLCMKYCIPYMVDGGGGSVVNIASEAGLVGIANQVAYNVSKSGVIALTRSSAIDFATKNIRVNCICPGRTLTPLVEKIIDDSEDPEETRRVLSDDRPLKRMGKPEEIANGILFLASDESKYTIGSVLSIDGGFTAQ
jgi:NAD(P)-dependent dehydrogenase (short-subunit alcohol dehydrogenase family)